MHRVWKLAHAIKSGKAHTANPYRNASVVHPAHVSAPVNGRDESDRVNMHTKKPKRSSRST
jgi:hypothetical protein